MLPHAASPHTRRTLVRAALLCLPCGLLAPSSAAAVCGAHVEFGAAPGSAGTSAALLPLGVLGAADGARAPGSLPPPRCTGAFCSGEPAPAPVPVAVPAPLVENWALLTCAAEPPRVGGGWWVSEPCGCRPIRRALRVARPPRRAA